MERMIIMRSEPVNSFEYRNAFLYVVIQEEPGQDPGSYLYCCGINLHLFCRLAWRKAGICSNPAVRGIQLLRTHVAAFAAEHGMIIEKAKEFDASALIPHNHGWYHQDPMRLKQASSEKMKSLLEFSVMDLVKTVLVVCVPDARVPAALPAAAELQKYLESLSVADERERVMAFERELDKSS